MAEQIGVTSTPPPQSMQMAVVVVALLPILIVYPFLQKHFNKGVITGAVKGCSLPAHSATTKKGQKGSRMTRYLRQPPDSPGATSSALQDCPLAPLRLAAP